MELIVLSLSLLICFAIIFKDFKKNQLMYVIIFGIGVIGSIPFEYPFILYGLWTHLIQPQILGVSWFAALMYIPLTGLSYWFGKYLNGKTKYNEYVLYFVTGMLLGFIIDTISTLLGFYSYNFIFPFNIGGIPFGITIAEGIAISVAIFIAKTVKEKIQE